MFYLSMILGTLISISSLSWLTAWIGLEMNLLSILPLMKSFKNKMSTESMIKYFITQAIASNILLFSIIIFTASINFSNFDFVSSMISLSLASSLFLKMGAAPFHFWLPEVISSMPWHMVLILLTWQKLAPMILLSNSMNNTMFLYSVIIFSAMIGSFLGINQTCIRKIMAYSSINHMGWMISALMISYNTWMLYFIIYSIINMNIIILLNKFNLYNLTQLFSIFSFNKKMKLLFMMNFFSLGGLPPFMGFLPKWITINQLINSSSYFMTMMLILLSLISLFFYIRLSFSSLTFNSTEYFKKSFWYSSFSLFLINLVSLMGLFLFSLVFF
uniref:NADH-ubiquinone oxidoreductase chain 2 n=1 Tax=Hylastes ater TaxID=512079 RepID=A0A343A5F7_9CUCU|nr:NADH dehydrogenase subunit 2 [Hylastes ater]